MNCLTFKHLKFLFGAICVKIRMIQFLQISFDFSVFFVCVCTCLSVCVFVVHTCQSYLLIFKDQASGMYIALCESHTDKMYLHTLMIKEIYNNQNRQFRPKINQSGSIKDRMKKSKISLT